MKIFRTHLHSTTLTLNLNRTQHSHYTHHIITVYRHHIHIRAHLCALRIYIQVTLFLFLYLNRSLKEETYERVQVYLCDQCRIQARYYPNDKIPNARISQNTKHF